MSEAPLLALDGAGVRWCLLRSGADLDVLVHPEDVRLVRTALTSFDEQRPWGRRPHRFFVAGETKLDLVTELAFGRRHELRTDAADDVLARRVRVGGVALPAPADRFWALLLHELLDRPEVRRVDELRALTRQGPVDDGPLIALVERSGWTAARIGALAAGGRFEELRPFADALRAHWPGSPLGAAARGGVRAALRRADRRVRSMR
jgi:hypothetical protein